MVKVYQLLLVVTLMVLVSTALFARIISTATLTLYGYVPLSFDLFQNEDGTYSFYTNDPNAHIFSQEIGEMLLFSIVMP